MFLSGYLGVDIKRLVLPVIGYLLDRDREMLAKLETLLSTQPSGISRLDVAASTFELARLDNDWEEL